jgi:hypothetical protein
VTFKKQNILKKRKLFPLFDLFNVRNYFTLKVSMNNAAKKDIICEPEANPITFLTPYCCKKLMH